MRKLCLALVSLVVLGSFVSGCSKDSTQAAQDKAASMDKNINDAGAAQHLRN